MFRCEICGVVVAPNTRASRVVLVVRPCTYPFRMNAHRDPKTHRREGKPKILTPSEHTSLLAARKSQRDPCDDPGGAGYEIVREALVCPACGLEWSSRPPVIQRE